VPRTRFVARPELAEPFAAVRRDFSVPDRFPPEVETAVATRPVGEPAPVDLRTGWVTLDPAGSRDLDQAFLLEPQAGGGWHLAYAIADVAAHVAPGGPVDAEAHVRGLTLYLPDGRCPLHPPALSEGRASLLPDQPTPALVWEIDIAADGSTTFAGLVRRTVTSTAQLAYETAGAAACPQVALLAEAGAAMVAAASRRGALDLPQPAQEVVRTERGWGLALRSPSDLEGWNAQMSLAVGRAAGALQAESGWGLLRTLPTAEPADVEAVRRSAAALGRGWDPGTPWADVVSRLDPEDPTSLAVLAVAGRLLRGAGYHVMVGGEPVADPPTHAAVASVYAHATAPLRRLADRYVGECCLAATQGVDPPAWARAGLQGLDELMIAANRRAGDVDRACVDTVEALLLDGRVGDVFPAVAVDERTIQVSDPVVRARCDGGLLPGGHVQARLTAADVARRTVRFEAVT
jgi:exoribonuclease R